MQSRPLEYLRHEGDIRPALRRAALLPKIAVFFGGVNLIVIQWILIKEVTALLLGTELVILLVSISYFAGISVGYLLVGRIQRKALPALAISTLALHLTLPVWFRLLTSGLSAAGAYPVAFILLPLLTVFTVPVFYSVLLPLFVDSSGEKLSTLYAIELFGSALGVLVLIVLGGAGLQSIYIVYTVALLVILWTIGVQWAAIIALAAICTTWLLVFPSANRWTNARFFEQLQGIPEGSITLFSGYSPYQKVDVLESPDGARYLFLDGLEHFGGNSGSRLNVILGRVPAQLVDPSNALVIGAGSMEMERMIADIAGHVTTVEIDPMVVDVSIQYLSAFNRMDILDNRTIIVDDAKHFIANTDQFYDLISTDTPAAFTIQTATLYSEPFFRAIQKRLYPGGVFAVNLTSHFEPDDLVSRRITSSLLAVFDEVMIVTSESAGWSFAYASDDLPFDREALERSLRRNDERDYIIFEGETIKAIVNDAQPITLDSMDIVLHISLDWMGDKLQW